MPDPGRPLLKWAGGKRQLLPVLRLHYPSEFKRYFEPFFGSGAVFFDLARSGTLKGRHVYLNDANRDLVSCYQTLRDQPDAVTTVLARLAKQHARHGAAFYYDVRDRRFNPARAEGRFGTPEHAAMLIYLNRTGFNGLFRLNRRGEFNVPAGRYAEPCICDPDHLSQVAATLCQPNVHIEHGSFESALQRTAEGDFVYCDPPYAPLSPTASFAQYTAGGFTELQQRRLQQEVVAACGRGAIVVLSNSSATLIERLYSSAEARRAGLRIHRVSARRAINSKAAARGVVDELLVTNALSGKAAQLPKPVMLRASLPDRSRRRA